MTSQSLARLADLAEGADTIQPPPRRAAIAATLRQLAGWARQDETTPDGMMGSLGVAFERLAEPHPGDDERVTARRKTCAELSAVALAAASERRDSHFAACAFDSARGGALTALREETDPTARARLAAVIETLAREGRELARSPAARHVSVWFEVDLPGGGTSERLVTRAEAEALAKGECARAGVRVQWRRVTLAPSHMSGGRTMFASSSEVDGAALPPPPVADDDGYFGPMRR